MASVRMAAGSVLGTITDTATAVSSIVNTASGSLMMLNDYVTRQRAHQQTRAIIETEDFEARLLEETSNDITQRREKIDTYLDAKEGRRAIYNAAHEKLSAAIELHKKAQSAQAELDAK